MSLSKFSKEDEGRRIRDQYTDMVLDDPGELDPRIWGATPMGMTSRILQYGIDDLKKTRKQEQDRMDSEDAYAKRVAVRKGNHRKHKDEYKAGKSLRDRYKERIDERSLRREWQLNTLKRQDAKMYGRDEAKPDVRAYRTAQREFAQGLKFNKDAWAPSHWQNPNRYKQENVPGPYGGRSKKDVITPLEYAMDDTRPLYDGTAAWPPPGWT